MAKDYIIQRLPSGWLRFSVGNLWAQVPPGFREDSIPDEYIFQYLCSRDIINMAWRRYMEEQYGCLKGHDD